jgi:hypothetical protein
VIEQMPDQDAGAIWRPPVVEPVGHRLIEREARAADERHRRGRSADDFGERGQVEDRVQRAGCGTGVVRQRAERFTPDRA